MYRTVEIGKSIEGGELEKILIKAAEDVGLKAKSVDTFTKRYRLGSVQETDFYDETNINLRGKILPFGNVVGIKKNEKRSWFAICTGINFIGSFGFGSKKGIEGYLNAVSAYI